MNINEPFETPEKPIEDQIDVPDETENIMISFVSPRGMIQAVVVQAVMKRSEGVSSLSFNFVQSFRGTGGAVDDADWKRTIRLGWHIDEVGRPHQSDFKIVTNMDVDAVFGAADCKLIDEDWIRLEHPRNINSFHCYVSPDLKKEQAATKAAQRAAIQRMEEMDRKKKEKLRQQQEQGSASQPASRDAGT